MYARLAPSKRPWNILLCTLSWIFWSNLTILFNKWILESTSFRYPILLTAWHLLFATLATQFLAQTTSLLDARHSIPMTPRIYMTKIAPIGVLYSGSLVCSNMAYLYLNIAFIQMLKASGPVVTLLTSYIFGVSDLSVSKIVNIALITLSVALTVSGEIHFSWTGVGLQMAALVFDAMRLVMIQILTSPSPGPSPSPSSSGSGGVYPGDEERGGKGDGDGEERQDSGGKDGGNAKLGKMNPLVSLYYTAPICAVMNGVLAYKAEIQPLGYGQDPDAGGNGAGAGSGLVRAIVETGIFALLANACVGFMLNVAVFTLIGKTSGLTMTLVSIPKNILLIVVSMAIWGTSVSMVQGVGYAGALLGLVVYSGGASVQVKEVLIRVGKAVGLGGGERGRYDRVAGEGKGTWV